MCLFISTQCAVTPKKTENGNAVLCVIHGGAILVDIHFVRLMTIDNTHSVMYWNQALNVTYRTMPQLLKIHVFL